MICSSVNLVRFIVHPQVGSDSNQRWRKNPVAGHCLKAFGERIAARDPDRETAEIHIRVALINRFSARGTAEIVRVA